MAYRRLLLSRQGNLRPVTGSAFSREEHRHRATSWVVLAGAVGAAEEEQEDFERGPPGCSPPIVGIVRPSRGGGDSALPIGQDLVAKRSR
jgi:hypothetical protein